MILRGCNIIMKVFKFLYRREKQMKIVGSKAESDGITLTSVNEDVFIDFEGGTPAIILEDESVLLFESVASYNGFFMESSFYNKETEEVDIDALEAAMTKEDDVDAEEYDYYGKPITAIALYDMDGDLVIRLFREEL